MSTVERLNLQLEEAGIDVLSDQIFKMLRNALQPDSGTSIEDAVTQITALLPEGRPYSTEVSGFLTTCYEVAEQIPYSHPAMTKLVTLIDLTLNSDQFPRVNDTRSLQTDPTLRYQKLGETLRDWWNSSHSDEGAARYVNFQNLVARIDERGMLKGCNLAIWVLEDAFEAKKGKTRDERQAYVMAALQYLLLEGDAVYLEVSDTNGLRRWRRWREQVSYVATRSTNDESGAYDQDTIELASRALVAMEAIERRKTG